MIQGIQNCHVYKCDIQLRINVTFHVVRLKVNSHIVTYNSNIQYVVFVEFEVLTYVFQR